MQVQAIPEDALHEDSDNEDKVDKDERLPQKDIDKRIAPDNEFSDSEDEGEGRRDNRSYKGRKRPRLEKGGGGGDNNKEPAVVEDKPVKEEHKIEKGKSFTSTNSITSTGSLLDEKDEGKVEDAKKDTGPAP